MKKLMYHLAVCVLVAVAAPGYCEDPDLAKLFRDKQLTGTIVIASLDGKTTYTHNDARANARFIPASTFKIPNTLISLEEGAIADGKEVLKWDGKNREIAAWNKDHCIETAFPVSCVWFYQELARRVGKEKYAAYLKKLNYGNAQAGPELTSFWLDGDLKISAVEQVAFLRGVREQKYAFKPSSYELLRKIMVVEQTTTYTIRAKTGLAQQMGWLVGYVEAGDKVWFFAANMDITTPEATSLRREITMKALKIKGII